MELARELMDVVPETSRLYLGALGVGGWIFTNTGHVEGVDRWLATVERLRDDIAADDEQVRILAQARMAAMAMKGEQVQAVELGLRELEAAAARGDAETEVAIAVMLPFFMATAMRHDEALAMSHRAIEGADALERRAWSELASVALGYTLSWLGSAEAIPVLERAIAELRLHGWTSAVATAERALAQAITTTGDPSEAATVLCARSMRWSRPDTPCTNTLSSSTPRASSFANGVRRMRPSRPASPRAD